jgi:hypothetical protein
MSLPIQIHDSFSQEPEITKIPRSKVGKLDVADTKAYQETVKYEEKLQSILNEILQKILKNSGDMSQIQFVFFQPVQDYFRAALQNVYAIGANYTNDAHSTIPYLSDNDNAQIKKLAGYGTSLFFKKVDNYFRREENIDQSDYFYSIQDKVTQIIKENTNADTSTNIVIQPKKVNLKSLSIDKQINNLVTTVVFMTLNIAVIQKTRQLLNLKSKDQTVALAGFNPFERLLQYQPTRDLLGALGGFGNLFDTGIQGLARSLGEKIGILRPPSEITRFVMWITKMDEKVCLKYCKPLDGQTFDTADLQAPIPIISTHPNCRCRIFSIDQNGNVLADVTE